MARRLVEKVGILVSVGHCSLQQGGLVDGWWREEMVGKRCMEGSDENLRQALAMERGVGMRSSLETCEGPEGLMRGTYVYTPRWIRT